VTANDAIVTAVMLSTVGAGLISLNVATTSLITPALFRIDLFDKEAVLAKPEQLVLHADKVNWLTADPVEEPTLNTGNKEQDPTFHLFVLLLVPSVQEKADTEEDVGCW
jgi:hypothetical protein